MRETNKVTMEDSNPSGALTVGQLKDLIREGVQAAMNGNASDRLLTPEGLAEHLKVPVSWVYEQSRQGNIPTHRLGRYIRFDLQEVLASQKERPPY